MRTQDTTENVFDLSKNQNSIPPKKRKARISEETLESSDLTQVVEENSENSHSLPPFPIETRPDIIRMEAYSASWNPCDVKDVPIPVIQRETQIRKGRHSCDEDEDDEGANSCDEDDEGADYTNRFTQYMEREWIICFLDNKALFFKGLKSGKYGRVFLLGPKRSKDIITHVLKICHKNQEGLVLDAIKMAKDFCVARIDNLRILVKEFKPFKVNERMYSHICTTYGGVPLHSFRRSFYNSKKVLLLIFIASRLLEEDGIRHIDMHHGNILVLVEPGYYYVKGTGGGTYKIPSSFRIMVIDFGHVQFSTGTFDRAELAGCTFLIHIERYSLTTVSLDSMELELEKYRINE